MRINSGVGRRFPERLLVGASSSLEVPSSAVESGSETTRQGMRRALILLLAAGVFGFALALPRTSRTAEDNALGESASPVEDEVDDVLSEDPDRSNETDIDDETEEENHVENVVEEDEEDAKKNEPTTSSPESKVMQTGNKKRKTKNSGLSKKMAAQLLPLLMIPMMIQAQLIPMMLFKLKLMALKALMLGKAALVIILLNLLRNAFIGADSMEEQYEQQSLASGHYGYGGNPEYGAWINKRRVYHVQPNGPYHGHGIAAENRPGSTSQTALLRPHSEPKESN